ncbi:MULTISPECIES: hypothetical protein [Pseudomonas putida group]|uniref:hypothetical protein n=1 Tax=Pseudomonas putida group TaxID=136845 RepID=UPI0018A8F836|nr:hypothetical protein [Pseudomonas fulva]MBF8776309.1 hypothetical protein [Pseudomonas fulva]
MTTKQDVAAALRAFEEGKAQKADRIKNRIAMVTTELHEAYRKVESWVYRIEGLTTEKIAASSHLEVEDQTVGWSAYQLNFAGTHIVFQPELKFDDVHLRVDWEWGDYQTILLKSVPDGFEVLDLPGRRSLGMLTQEHLLGEVIRIAQAQPI